MKKIVCLGVSLSCLFLYNCPARADQVFADDVIVQGSECVGQDCINNENFGFDTLILKENNLRIYFNDTSTSAGFPTNDWRITINDSASGGNSYFAIDDASAGTTPFRIEAGAPANSFYIDSSGMAHFGVGLASDYSAFTDSTAIGLHSSAGDHDTAIGYYATVTADYSVAVGARSYVAAERSVAIGANSTVLSGATNSVALGQGSIASEPDTVSVGSVGNERRITNVAAGIHSTDAVNVAQLQSVSNRVTNNSANIAANRNQIAQNTNEIAQNSADIADNRASITQLQADMDDAYAGIAAAAAMVAASPSAPGKTTLNLGAANYKGENAVGLSFAHRFNGSLLDDTFSLNGGVSVASGNTLTRVGGSWEF